MYKRGCDRKIKSFGDSARAKSLIQQTGGAGDQNCDLWAQGEWFRSINDQLAWALQGCNASSEEKLIRLCGCLLVPYAGYKLINGRRQSNVNKLRVHTGKLE